MNCDQIEELISDLIDDELSEQARAGVQQHIASCGRCAGVHRQMLRTVRFVRANSSPVLRDGTPGGWYADFTRSLVDPEYRDDSLGMWDEMIARTEREQGGAS